MLFWVHLGIGVGLPEFSFDSPPLPKFAPSSLCVSTMMFPFFRSQRTKKKLLNDSPKPLFHQSERDALALFFSAKAGCTFAVQWFLSQRGLLEAARAFNPWVHQYRIKVHYQSPEYLNHLAEIADRKTKVIKIVRNPYGRAVSSYIHAVGHTYEYEALSQFLGRPVDATHGFSFREFVHYLGSIDLATCNPHHRLQCHAAERSKLVTPHYIVTLENSMTELNQMEAQLSMPITPRATMEEFANTKHATKRKDYQRVVADDRFEKKALAAQMPQMTNFYDEELQAKVRALYEIDFQAYSYDLSSLTSNRQDDFATRRDNFMAFMGRK
jgi:hypothetical protein